MQNQKSSGFNQLNNKKENTKIDFLKLICKDIPYDYKLKKYKVRKTPVDPFLYEIDDSHRFRNTVTIYKGQNNNQPAINKVSTAKSFFKKKQLEKEIKKQFNDNLDNKTSIDIQPVEIADWENSIVDFDDQLPAEEQDVSTREYVETLLQSDWEKNIFFDPETMPACKNYMTLYLDDPNLIFEKIEEKKNKIKKKNLKLVFSDKPLKNKYNISNDKYYVNDEKSKASLGNFGVQHSLPALKLDLRFYKTNYSKEELRNFHRPPICLKSGQYKFKTSSIGSFTSNTIKKSSELTLTDFSNFIIFEYSEEFPLFIVNPGMVSLLNIYYRKTDAADEPPYDNLICLENEDEDPFYGYGSITPGSFVETLANNLFIAPTVKHKNNDFICILDGNDILMRPIDFVYLVGQELPKEEVFAPHSRKLNQFCKDRLKVAAYRIFAKGSDLQMNQLDQMFPYFSEGSKRKWLKEYCDCIKKGRDNVWALKDSFSIIGEEDLRKMVTPENICQYESMLSTERRMHDLGYKCSDNEEEETEYDFFIPSWFLSRSFINAVNGRGLLELSGPADPSGNGEAFSFRRIKLKKGSESENRKIIAEQQASYKDRVDTIWKKQLEFLTKDTSDYQPQFNRSVVDLQSETTQAESKVLVIKRTYNENGNIICKTEKIYDSRIIKAYLRARKNVKIEEKKTSLTCSSCGQSGHMKTNKFCPNFVGSAKPIKKLVEAKKPSVVFQDKLIKVVGSLAAVPFSNAFHRPVSSKKFPTYQNFISNPMDLFTIKGKIRNNEYSTFDSFMNDVDLISSNCKVFNGVSHTLSNIADQMCQIARDYYEEHKNEIAELEAALIN